METERDNSLMKEGTVVILMRKSQRNIPFKRYVKPTKAKLLSTKPIRLL